MCWGIWYIGRIELGNILDKWCRWVHFHSVGKYFFCLDSTLSLPFHWTKVRSISKFTTGQWGSVIVTQVSFSCWYSVQAEVFCYPSHLDYVHVFTKTWKWKKTFRRPHLVFGLFGLYFVQICIDSLQCLTLTLEQIQICSRKHHPQWHEPDLLDCLSHIQLETNTHNTVIWMTKPNFGYLY